MSTELNQDTELSKVDANDRDILLRAPAIVALLAAISDDGEVSESEKTESIKLAHLRTYTSPEILHNYYKEVDKVFTSVFNEEFEKMPETMEERKTYLAKRLKEIDAVLPKLNNVYAKELVISLKSFSRHVFKTESSFLEHFLMPLILGRIEQRFFDPKIGE